jgi:membrane-bound lytic murein transglycosylase B
VRTPNPAPTNAAPTNAAPTTVAPRTGAPAELSAPAFALKQARSADELARRLIKADTAPHTAGSSESVLTDAAFSSQILYRQLARTPAWRAEVLKRVRPRLRADVRDHLAARKSLRSVLTTLSGEVPPWRIVAPAPASELLKAYREGERSFGIPWEVLAAINLVETGFGKIRGYSTAGAQGPMQFMPATWAAYGKGDINDPHDAILAAARYLAAVGGDTPGGLDRALYSYNNHAGYVAGVRAYAAILGRDPAALGTLRRWQIVFLSSAGDLWLPIGYRSRTPVAVADYIRQHPERHLGTLTN